jgi:topoisomerase-4 subunit A
MAKEKQENRVFENEMGVQGQYKNWFLDYASYVI